MNVTWHNGPETAEKFVKGHDEGLKTGNALDCNAVGHHSI